MLGSVAFFPCSFCHLLLNRLLNDIQLNIIHMRNAVVDGDMDWCWEFLHGSSVTKGHWSNWDK